MVISFVISDLNVGKNLGESLIYWEPYLCLADKVWLLLFVFEVYRNWIEIFTAQKILKFTI